MAYVIHTRYKEGVAKLQADTRPRHLEFLDENKERLLAAGALIDDDGAGAHGGIIILDTDDREEAERFIADDPYTRVRLFESVTVTRWRKAFFNFERLI